MQTLLPEGLQDFNKQMRKCTAEDDSNSDCAFTIYENINIEWW